MYDSIWDPFNPVTDEKEFLSVDSWTFMKVPDKLGTFSFLFSIAGTKNHSQRTRYSFWMALGDIGGFHDGMNLLVGILMGPLSAALFFQSFVVGGVYEASSTKDQRIKQKQSIVMQQGSKQVGINSLSQGHMP